LTKSAATGLLSSFSSKKVENATPTPSFEIIAAFSQVSPANTFALMPFAATCGRIKVAVLMDDGMKMQSGLADLILVRIALKSDSFV